MKVYFLQPSSTRDGLYMEMAVLNPADFEFILSQYIEDYEFGIYKGGFEVNKEKETVTFKYEYIGDIYTKTIKYTSFDVYSK